MSGLIAQVEIDRRFARSARIDADLKGTPPLVGYVLQASIEKALTTLAESQIESKQSAFTWTGPYGGGKSSAALLVANLVAGVSENRKIAQRIAGKPLAALYAKAFPTKRGDWSVVAVTGSRERLRGAIADAAAVSLGWSEETHRAARDGDEALIRSLMTSAETQGGVLLLADELGKMLEHEAIEGGDVHLLQDLAERASRSDGRLVVVGILHQSFDQYAARAARDARQDWAKVQGRYQDIAFLSGADETVALLGRAIRSAGAPPSAAVRAQAVAAAVAKRRPTAPEQLATALAATWPLNPVTALLLGPVSRQRFAQNERSVFGFLSSAEPAGFQQFLASADEGATYDPAWLWDYLASNFGMALATGADGGKFSLAFEAIERAGAKGGRVHVALTKTAAVIEFFRNGSGVALADDILAEAVPDTPAAERQAALDDLLEWAILIRQPRLNGYALFAGSDFDLDEAIARALAPIDAAQLAVVPAKVGIGMIPAKRHYFHTGALRTFEVVLQLASAELDAADLAAAIMGRTAKASGALVLVLNDGTLNAPQLDALCKSTAKHLKGEDAIVAVGAGKDSYALRTAAAELFAVERVFRDHPQLEGDRIARRAVAARQAQYTDELHRALEASLAQASWRLAPKPDKAMHEPLAIVASALADEGYRHTPILHSELLQRDRASSNANAALRELAYAMVRHPDRPQLDIEGFPAEMGLYLTVLKPFGLHRQSATGEWNFHAPDGSAQGKSLQPAWSLVDGLDETDLRTIYAKWAAAPYGLKAGVMPLLALAYIMANRDRLAIYVDGVFQTAFDDVFVDRLMQKGTMVTMRRIERSRHEAAFLGQLATILGLGEASGSLPVAQALFRRFEALPPYAARTAHLDSDTRIVRDVVLKAKDPEALLFHDLPDALGERFEARVIADSLVACEGAYPQMLDRMRLALARALGVDPGDFAGVAHRADTVHGLTNDYNFDAFAMRAAAFETDGGDIEGLLSLLLHRPSRSWSDRDRDQALVELARFGRQFRELEALSVVQDRRSHSEAMAVVVGIDPQAPPVLRSFVLTEDEKRQADILAERLLAMLDGKDGENLNMAALGRAIAKLAGDAVPAQEEAA